MSFFIGLLSWVIGKSGYEPPAGDAADLVFEGAYVPPAGNAANLTME